jgi:replicative DNA helicase
MNLHLVILKAFLESTHYQKYNDYLNYENIKEESPEIFRLFQCIRHLQNKESKNYTISDLQLAFAILYPASDRTQYNPLLQSLSTTQVDGNTLSSYLETIKNRSQALKIATRALSFAEGHSTFEQYQETLNEFKEQPIELQQEWINDDLEQLYHRHYERPGLRWGLESLNKSLGSLRLGTFGFIFARPETGKTTFLASQLQTLSTQVERPIWWFTNEQSGEEILTRCYQSVLGLSLVDLYRDISNNRTNYLQKTKGNIRIVYDTQLSKTTVERLLKQHGAGLIIFDQIDPIKGFKADRDDLELTAIYEWARSLASQYSPVIGVCQAGQSGDGKRWLTMNDVANSKTGKIGAADWILGIGKALDDGLESYRYFSLVKNKLSGDSDTNPALRHGKFEVRIKPEICGYEDL